MTRFNKVKAAIFVPAVMAVGSVSAAVPEDIQAYIDDALVDTGVIASGVVVVGFAVWGVFRLIRALRGK